MSEQRKNGQGQRTWQKPVSHFINPYNFIPLSGKKQSRYNYQNDDVHSGVIEYSITTKTPLFIPNSSSDHAFNIKIEGVPEKTNAQKSDGQNSKNLDHKSYDFFSYEMLEEGTFYDDKCHEPVIPGSELRGCVRNLYETLTGSCMGILNEDTRPIKRTGEVFKPGLIHKKENGTFELLEAQSYRIDIVQKESDSYREGQPICFKKPEKNANKRGYEIIGKGNFSTDKEDEKRFTESGYLLIGGWGGTKKHAHVFKRKTNVHKDSFSEDDFEILKLVIASYQEQNDYKDDYDGYEKELAEFKKTKEERFFPVYYSDVEINPAFSFCYYSPAAITKEVASRKVGESVGNWTPCKKAGELCPACDLFGMVGLADANKKKEEGDSDNRNGVNAKSSKLRFADARLEKGKRPKNDNEKKALYEKIITLQTLNGPKLSNAEFYLKQPEGADFWTYDYYICYDKEKKKVVVRKNETEDGVLIRGRKFYWHQPNFKRISVEPTHLNVTVRPLTTGITFIGKLYFDRISKRQLRQLIWIMNGGEDSSLSYKLGGAKPLGYGSVDFRVRKVTERKIIWDENRYAIYQEESSKPDCKSVGTYQEVEFLDNEEVEKAFKCIQTFDAVGNGFVSYPVTPWQKDSATEGFKWFAEMNHVKAVRSGDKSHSEQSMRNSRMDEKLEYALPEIDDRLQYLPKHTGVERPHRCANCKKGVQWDFENDCWEKYCKKCKMKEIAKK